MVIKRTRLMEIMVEEVKRGLYEFSNSNDDEEDPERKPAEVGSADDNPTKGQPPAEGSGGSVKGPNPGPVDQQADDGTQTDDAEPGHDEDDNSGNTDGRHDADGPDDEQTGAVNNEMSGKTIQSISIDPKSKILPGAKEIILSTNESTDALRILVTATGSVKFFYKGQIHDLP
jgi:hypothetical protein